MTATYPPHRPVLASEARAADAEAASAFGVPTLVLMDHAGRELARVVESLLPREGRVAVLCGPGNNGGDGYACARFLRSHGVETRVVRCAPRPPGPGDAAVEHDALAREAEIGVAAVSSDAPVVDAALAGAHVVVDALFGTGARPLVSPWVDWVERMNHARALRVSADLPSGLDADDGAPRPVAVRADVTVAMGLVKRGCTTPAGAPWCGRVVEADVGLPGPIHRRFLRDVVSAAAPPPRASPPR
jgi:NAD(P)H-hydrate epimerase